MQTITMLQFRQHAERIIDRLRKGQRLILTYRGKPVARLEPISSAPQGDQDPFYHLDRLADARARSLTNPQIDKTVYGT